MKLLLMIWFKDLKPVTIVQLAAKYLLLFSIMCILSDINNVN